ncbi:TPA: LPXTG cell wall anchor domain-containing protein [Streptococcus suis]|nr:LPXTG cell wall anchor domain-containing protein [Streptococcus suis]
MQVKKFAKWGLALTSTLVLSGVVAQVGGNLVNNSTVVHAEEIQSRVAVHAGYYFNGELVFAAFDLEEFWVSPGESRSIVVPAVDGYVYEGKYLLSNRNGERLLQGSPSARYEDTVGSRFVDVILIYAPVDKPVDTPTEQPAEQPTDQPVEQPVEQPADQPVETPAEQPADQPVETPAEQPTEQPVENPADQPTDQPVDQPAEQPAEQPTEQPAETPTDKPVDTPTEKTVETPTDKPVDIPIEKPAETPTGKPVDTPTDKPVEPLTDASSLTDQTAGKVQAVTATDKKTVDKSAPSTPAVKPEEGSQTTAKTLPKTGDSSSMLLVLGGILSGLSGLGLAATSRKRD